MSGYPDDLRAADQIILARDDSFAFLYLSLEHSHFVREDLSEVPVVLLLPAAGGGPFPDRLLGLSFRRDHIVGFSLDPRDVRVDSRPFGVDEVPRNLPV